MLCLARAVCCTAASAQPAQQDAALPVVNTPAPAAATLTAQQLAHLVAPVALYPDQVLTDILAAATYPAQVVEAQRFVADPAHAGLTGAALAEAAAGQEWDSSVKALLMFPAVLQMMDGNLDWTEHLGRAFIAQQADVMNAVQQLRLAAEQSGRLASGPNATVVNEGGDILIDPPSQQDFYLPTYQPDCVFGPNPACDSATSEVYWASGVLLPYGYPQWGFLDWNRREIRVRYPGAREQGEGPGIVWRHANLRMASGSFITGNPGQFSDAPPASMPLPRQEGFARPAIPLHHLVAAPHVNTVPAFRPAPHATGGTHAVTGLGHRG
jgi:hypothetical protein